MIWRKIEEFKSKSGLRRGKRTPKSALKDYKEEDRRLHLNRSLPLWVLPSQIRQTEDSQADGKLQMGLVDGFCFLGGIFMIFGDQGRSMES